MLVLLSQEELSFRFQLMLPDKQVIGFCKFPIFCSCGLLLELTQSTKQFHYVKSGDNSASQVS
jgi:hypothetical protein